MSIREKAKVILAEQQAKKDAEEEKLVNEAAEYQPAIFDVFITRFQHLLKDMRDDGFLYHGYMEDYRYTHKGGGIEFLLKNDNHEVRKRIRFCADGNWQPNSSCVFSRWGDERLILLLNDMIDELAEKEKKTADDEDQAFYG